MMAWIMIVMIKSMKSVVYVKMNKCVSVKQTVEKGSKFVKQENGHLVLHLFLQKKEYVSAVKVHLKSVKHPVD